MKQKTIMFYLPSIFMGGTEIGTLNLIKNLKDYKIIVAYTGDNESEKMMSMLKEHAEVIKITEDDYFNYETDILISVHHFAGNIAILDKIIRKKTFHVIHTVGRAYLNDKVNYDLFDEIIFVSQATKERLLDLYPDNKKVQNALVIHNLIDNDAVLASAEEFNAELPKKALNLVTIATLVPHKGYQRMAHLISLFDEKKIDYHWYIFGTGIPSPAGEESKQKVLNHLEPFKDRITILDTSHNPFPYVQKADYLLHLSDFETWGLVITEAKILGTPCIVSNFKAAYEQIEDNKNGFILDLEDLDSYQTRVNEIVNSKTKLRENVKDYRFDNTTALNHWQSLIEKALN